MVSILHVWLGMIGMRDFYNLEAWLPWFVDSMMIMRPTKLNAKLRKASSAEDRKCTAQTTRPFRVRRFRKAKPLTFQVSRVAAGRRDALGVDTVVALRCCFGFCSYFVACGLWSVNCHLWMFVAFCCRRCFCSVVVVVVVVVLLFLLLLLLEDDHHCFNG